MRRRYVMAEADDAGAPPSTETVTPPPATEPPEAENAATEPVDAGAAAPADPEPAAGPADSEPMPPSGDDDAGPGPTQDAAPDDAGDAQGDVPSIDEQALALKAAQDSAAAMAAEVETLKARLAQVDEERTADLTERLEALEAKTKAQAEELAEQAAALRSAALDKAGIKAKYRAMVPDVDLSTDDGKAALAKWIGEWPEAVDAAPAEPVKSEAPPKQARWERARTAVAKRFGKSALDSPTFRSLN